MANDRWKEVIDKAKEIAGVASEATEPALPTTEQTWGCLPFHEYIASKRDARKHCLGQCPDLKLLTPWPTKSVKLQLYQEDVYDSMKIRRQLNTLGINSGCLSSDAYKYLIPFAFSIKCISPLHEHGDVCHFMSTFQPSRSHL
jgi:hypothetical protein